MYSKVYVRTFILLSLEIAAGCWSNTPSEQQPPSREKPGHDLQVPQNFSCFSPNLYHKLYQDYQNDSLQIAMTDIPPQAWVQTTRFIVKQELIDIKGKIHCENSSNDTSKEKTKDTWLGRPFKTIIDKIYNLINSVSKKHVCAKCVNSESHKTLIKILANETFKDNEEPAFLEYNEKQNVSFSCLENSTTISNIVLGLINTNSNMTKTYEVNSTHEIFNKTDNGTILCCIYYEVNYKTAEEMWITRHVVNKTKLFYTTVQQDALEAKEISTSNSTGNLNADSRHPNIKIIIIATAVAVAFLMLVIIVICRKRCRKKPQLDTKVLYADLDFLRQIQPDSSPRSGPEEESPYAQIIGVIRPQTE